MKFRLSKLNETVLIYKQILWLCDFHIFPFNLISVFEVFRFDDERHRLQPARPPAHEYEGEVHSVLHNLQRARVHHTELVEQPRRLDRERAVEERVEALLEPAQLSRVFRDLVDLEQFVLHEEELNGVVEELYRLEQEKHAQRVEGWEALDSDRRRCVPAELEQERRRGDDGAHEDALEGRPARQLEAYQAEPLRHHQPNGEYRRALHELRRQPPVPERSAAVRARGRAELEAREREERHVREDAHGEVAVHTVLHAPVRYPVHEPNDGDCSVAREEHRLRDEHTLHGPVEARRAVLEGEGDVVLGAPLPARAEERIQAALAGYRAVERDAAARRAADLRRLRKIVDAHRAQVPHVRELLRLRLRAKREDELGAAVVRYVRWKRAAGVEPERVEDNVLAAHAHVTSVEKSEK